MFQALHLYLYFGYERYKHLGQFLIIETALKKDRNVEQSATYCTLVQEGCVKIPKLLFGLFGTEVFEELSMEVTELTIGKKTILFSTEQLQNLLK